MDVGRTALSERELNVLMSNATNQRQTVLNIDEKGFSSLKQLVLARRTHQRISGS